MMSAVAVRRLMLLVAAVLATASVGMTLASAAQARSTHRLVATYTYDVVSASTTTVANVALATATNESGLARLPELSVDSISSLVATEDAAAAANPLTDTTNSRKVLDQMAQGDYHAFPESVDGFANQSHVTTELGADGSPYTHVRIPGGYGSSEGVFHYIFGDNGVVNHRLFEPGG